ncbi:MAG: hypothetical protein LQ337_000292 [Flavoplaca oasis]|nr:MAG: hypothetical protein LQ337_000292 [Flavoplaca oasis]
MATRLLLTSPLIRQGPVRALANRVIGFPRPLSFESCYNFYARSRQSPYPSQYFVKPTAVHPIRGFASTTIHQQQPESNTLPTHQGSRGVPNNATRTNTETSINIDTELTLQTTPQFAITRFSSIQQEVSFIKSTLQDSGTQLTSAALADKKAKLSSLELAHRQWYAKALWWKDIIEQEPKQIESYSDVYQRVKVVKNGLKTDSESDTPVWTARERGEMEKWHDCWEAETRKKDKWYKKIAWGPSIIGTAILNLILN